MNVKKIVIIFVALVAAGLIYVGVDRYRGQEIDSVKIQKNPFSKKNMKKAGNAITNAANDVGDAIKIEPGQNGSVCTSNSQCNSHSCLSGLCQNKGKLGETCNNNGNCQSENCIDTICSGCSLEGNEVGNKVRYSNNGGTTVWDKCCPGLYPVMSPWSINYCKKQT